MKSIAVKLIFLKKLEVFGMKKIMSIAVAFGMILVVNLPAVASTPKVEDLVAAGEPVEITEVMKCSGEKNKFIWCELTVRGFAEDGIELSGDVAVRLCSSPYWLTFKGGCYPEDAGVWTKTVDVALGDTRKLQFPNPLKSHRRAEISAIVLETASFSSSGRVWQVTNVKPLKVTISHPNEVVHGEKVKFTVWTSPKFTGTCDVWRDSGMGWQTSKIKIKNGKGSATVRYLWSTDRVRTNYIKVECSSTTYFGMGEKYMTGYKD